MALAMSHFFFFDSRDSKNHHPDNTSSDFTVELPKTYDLNGDWEVALKEIEVRVSEDLFYVFSDICQESYVSETLAPVLRSVRRDKKNKTLFTFTDPYYIQVRTDKLSRVRIFIRGRNLQLLVTDTTVLYCTLHLRKKTWT